MKGKSRSISKKLSAITLSCLVMFGTVGAVLPTYAADPVKGIEIKADRTELDQSVSDAKNAGAEIVQDADVDKGVVKSEAEADSKRAEIEADYKQQVQQLKDAKKAAQKYSQDKKKYDEAKKKYDEELAKYNIAKKKYDTDLAAYNKAMEELEKKKNQDGYMNPPYGQPLIFKSEPNAKLTLSGKKYTKDEFNNTVKSWNLGTEPWRYAYFDMLNNGQPGSAARVMLEKDKPFVATYTNLQNSSYKGKKISKVVYTYTFKGIDGVNNVPDKLPVILQKDPTVTIWYNDFFGSARINLKAQFYDDQGQLIDPTGSLLNFSSLNRGNGSGVVYVDAIEKVAAFNGEFVPISGSSIKVQPDGGAYASTDNTSTARGSKFNVQDWDNESSAKQWYGAIVGRVTNSEISLDMASYRSGCVWFALNSDVKAIGLPTQPVEPTPPTPPTEPEKPSKVAYHYDILYVQSQVEKNVLDGNNQDINNGTVQIGSVVKFALHTTNIPAGHEKINSLVFSDVLPSGYEVDVEATKQASADYDISYDASTRRMVFTANAALLTQINSDLTKTAKVPAPIVTGKVTKESTTYVNDFDLTINNVYSVKSNVVKVHTPTPKVPNHPNKPDLQRPKTGDLGNLPIMILLLLASGGVLAGALVKKRKKQA